MSSKFNITYGCELNKSYVHISDLESSHFRDPTENAIKI